MSLAEVVVDLAAAFLGVGIDAYREETFFFGTQDGEEIMRRDAVEGHREIEIRAVFVGVLRFLSGFGDGGDYAALAEDRAEILADFCGLAQPFGNYVARSGEGVVNAGNLSFDKGSRGCDDIAGADVPHHVRERLEAKLLRYCGTGAALRLEREVYILKLSGGDTVFDSVLESVIQCAGLGNGLEDCVLAFFHFGEDVDPVLDFGHLGIIHTARLFLSVAADERDGVAVLEHVGAILDLPALELEMVGYVVDV